MLNDGTIVCTFSARLTGTFTDSSGVFSSKDGGNTWTDLTGPNMHWWTRDLVVDPTDPKQNTWYVGVFSGWGGASNNRGGLYRTTDRGVTWSNILPLSRVRSCTVNPKNGKQVFATTEAEGLWFTGGANATDPDFEQVQSYPYLSPGRVYFNPFKATEAWVASVGNGLKVGQMASQPIP